MSITIQISDIDLEKHHYLGEEFFEPFDKVEFLKGTDKLDEIFNRPPYTTEYIVGALFMDGVRDIDHTWVLTYEDARYLFDRISSRSDKKKFLLEFLDTGF